MSGKLHTASAVIVAAGSGLRMRSTVAKQFIEIGNIPIIARTLQVFALHRSISNICLVVPGQDIDFCRQVILPHVDSGKQIMIIAGGARRQDSVYLGIKAMDRHEPVVVIHDGVRPFVSPENIEACVDGAAETGACIAGIPASDTLKRVSEGSVIAQTVSRDNIWLAQTPQAFGWDLIKKAFEQASADGFAATDDASLVERMGVPVLIIEGSRRNIKITTPEDLEMAAGFLSHSPAVK